MINNNQLYNLIINKILKEKTVSISSLEERAKQRCVSIEELYTVLERIHRDKRIRQTVAKGEIVYSPTPERRATVATHLRWIKDNYPDTSDFEMPFPEIDMSYLFLKTKEERDAFKAEMKGQPVYMYAKKRKRHPA
jgi:hypothetical protein